MSYDDDFAGTESLKITQLMSLIIVNIFLAGKYEFDIHFFPHVQIWL